MKNIMSLGIIAVASFMIIFLLGLLFINRFSKPITAQDYNVELINNSANPNLLRVPVGSFVQFNTKDNKFHNLAQGHGNESGDKHEHDENGIESGKFGPEEAYKIQLKKVGIFAFHDHLNPDIYATIIAYDPNNPSK